MTVSPARCFGPCLAWPADASRVPAWPLHLATRPAPVQHVPAHGLGDGKGGAAATPSTDSAAASHAFSLQQPPLPPSITRHRIHERWPFCAQPPQAAATSSASPCAGSPTRRLASWPRSSRRRLRAGPTSLPGASSTPVAARARKGCSFAGAAGCAMQAFDGRQVAAS